MKTGQTRQDSEGIYFARELELLKPQAYQRAYPEMKFATAIPTSADKDPGAQTITYEMYDLVGIAKIISNYADDLPRADIRGRQFSVQVQTLATSAGWNYGELQAGIKTGKPINSRKLDAAQQVLMRLVDKLAFLGDTETGLVGLTTIPNMPNTVVATVSGATTWAAKLALGTDAGKNAVLDDLNIAFTRMQTATKGIEVPDTLALSPTSYAQISQTPRTAQSDTTLLDFFLKAHPGVEVIVIPWLETSGTGGARQMLLYRRDPMKLELEIPEDLVIHNQQERGLEWVVPLSMRFGGVVCRFPLSRDSSYGM